MKDSYIYVASPYSHPDLWMMEERHRAVSLFVARKIKEGHVLYSPIVHNHPLRKLVDLPAEWEYWKKLDSAMLLQASMLWVFQLSGWENSKGVKDEIILAIENDIPVEYW